MVEIINEIEANEYGGVQLPPKIECHFPLKKETNEIRIREHMNIQVKDIKHCPR